MSHSKHMTLIPWYLKTNKIDNYGVAQLKVWYEVPFSLWEWIPIWVLWGWQRVFMCSVIKPNTYRRCVNFTENQGMVMFEVSPFKFLMREIIYCLKYTWPVISYFKICAWNGIWTPPPLSYPFALSYREGLPICYLNMKLKWWLLYWYNNKFCHDSRLSQLCYVF